MEWYPLQFEPLYKERPWGGRELDGWGGRRLPKQKTIGESWELVDRPSDQSVVKHGPLTGKTLRWLMERHGTEVAGEAHRPGRPFPLLVKLLDCRERLSLQVHPPAKVASQLKGEPKTESWFILKAEQGSTLMAGLKKGATKAGFEKAIRSNKLEPLVHEFGVGVGNYIFIPSGRVHAIGGGLVLLEIQQNSDSTYRVYDWGRTGLDGKPRDLHLSESLASIDYEDFEPKASHWDHATGTLVRCPEFEVSLESASACDELKFDGFRLIYVLDGQGSISDQPRKKDEFWLLPAALGRASVHGDAGFRFFVAGVP